MNEINTLIGRLKDAERGMHDVWSAHCAGRRCKGLHKPIWMAIQMSLLAAIKELEKGENHERSTVQQMSTGGDEEGP